MPYKNPEKQKEYREKHREKAKEYRIKYYKENSGKWTGYNRKSQKEHPDRVREQNRKWLKEHLEQEKERKIKYYKEHPEKCREYSKRRDNKRKSISKNRISGMISCAIRKSLKDNKKGIHWEILVNYGWEQFKQDFEGKFLRGMSWDNYGRKLGCWSIDHIIPISRWEFNFSEDREFKQCWALCNLRPLMHVDNIRKSDKTSQLTLQEWGQKNQQEEVVV